MLNCSGVSGVGLRLHNLTLTSVTVNSSVRVTVYTYPHNSVTYSKIVAELPEFLASLAKGVIISVDGGFSQKYEENDWRTVVLVDVDAHYGPYLGTSSFSIKTYGGLRYENGNQRVLMVNNNEPGAGSKVKLLSGQEHIVQENGTLSPCSTKVASISVLPSSTSLKVSTTRTLTATVLPSTATNKNVIWSSSDTTVASVNSSGIVNARSTGTAVITAKSAEDGSISATCTIMVQPMLLYQTRDTEVKWFENESATTETVRPDLLYNDLPQTDILRSISCINRSDFTYYQIDYFEGGGYEITLSVNERKKMFLDMTHRHFTNDTFKPIITDMINHFMLESSNNFTGTIDGYSVYKNSSLTRQVQDHSQSTTYVNNIKNTLEKCLKQNSGNLIALEYDPSKRFDYNLRKQHTFISNMGYNQPVFNSRSDNTAGLTICLDSLQGNKVEILAFNLNGNSYNGTMRFTYYDHFGLDSDDMKGLVVSSLQGFRQWFILQHWNELEATPHPKPFITTIEFTTSFAGSIS